MAAEASDRPAPGAAASGAAVSWPGLSVAVSGDGMGAKLRLEGFEPAAWKSKGGNASDTPARLRAHLEALGLSKDLIRDDMLEWICGTLAAPHAASLPENIDAAQSVEVAQGLAPAHEEPQGLAFQRAYLSNAEAIADLRRKADTWGVTGVKESIDPDYWVSPGETVLSFQAVLPGREGRDVFGAPIPFIPVRDRLPPFGKTLAVRKQALIALCEGALILEDGVLKVLGSDSLPTCQVAVAEDRMSADLVLAGSALNDWTVTLDMVRASLREQGVICMLPEPDIQAALDRFNHDRLPQTLQIARGRAPAPAQEGQVLQLIDPEPQAPEPGPDGSIDFKHFSFFRTVEKGDRLARIIPPRPGEAGMDVHGQALPPPPAPPFECELGRNTAFAKDDPQIVEAAKPGRLGFRKGMPEVVEVLDVSGDVSLKTGHISFPGAVKVSGDVHGKMKIDAVGDVEVVGAVEDSFIQSDGAIVVRGGVNGSNGGLIKSRLSSVTIGYLHNQRIESHSHIVVYNEIINSQLFARQSIAMRYGRYSVLGGHLLAGESMDLFNVGSEAAIKTILEVGKDFEVEAEMAAKNRRLQENSSDLDFLRDMDEQLARILRLRRSSDEDLLLHKRVQGGVEILERWIGGLKKDLGELSRRLYTSDPCEILIRGIIHPGTVIRWRDHVLVVPGPLVNRKWIFREKSPLPPAEGRNAG
jgi:uncharacterized protein (DUF342 family)